MNEPVVNPQSAYIRQLAEVGAEIEHVRAEEVLGRTHRARATGVRAAIMVALHGRGWHLEEIARAMGRDHATVHHHVEQAPGKLRADADYRYLVQRLTVEALRLEGGEADMRGEEWLRRRVVALEAALDVLRIDVEAMIAERRNPVVTRGGRREVA